MKTMTYFSSFLNWLKLTETFINPDKKISGKWQLYEYYTEYDNQLLHFTKNQLKKDNRMMVIEFKENGTFELDSNIKLPLFKRKGEQFKWGRQRNFITIFNSGDPENNTEFQFALQKNHLRLLNKNNTGEIQFFGFFSELATADKK